MDGVVDLDRIAEVIAAMNVQAVALQEVDYFNNRNNMDQAAEIARRLGPTWKSRFFKSIDWNAGQYGNAILYDGSVLTVLDSKHLPLPGAEARSAGLMYFRHSGGVQFQFVATHLTHRPDEEHLRQQSIAIINDNLFAGVPAVLAGDLNAGPDTPSVRFLAESGWTITNPLEKLTFPADSPTLTIDYIAVMPGEMFDVLDTRVVQNAVTQVASDHLPLFTRFYVYGPSDF
jgi:endonuclease/exonuclease/phosphatase family metal-dependent hydrolase